MLRILSYLLTTAPSVTARQRGATLIEYALIVAVIAVAVFLGASATGLDDAIGEIFGNAETALKNAVDESA